MVEIENTNNQYNKQTYKKPGFLTITGGTVAGLLVGGLLVKSNEIPSKYLHKKLNGLNNLTEDEFIKVSKGVTEAFQSSGLAKKGVEILHINDKNSEKIFEMFRKEYKFCPESIKRISYDVLKEGENACYLSSAKKILMPEKKLALAVFHEMGHALNGNFSILGTLLQKSRILATLVLPIIIISLFKTKKAPNEEPKSKMDKFTDVIKNNTGKLVFITSLPILIEEAMASIKGNNLAKKVLDPSLAKKVIKNNKIAYLTHFGGILALSTGLAIWVKVKDFIAKPKPIKTEST